MYMISFGAIPLCPSAPVILPINACVGNMPPYVFGDCIGLPICQDIAPVIACSLEPGVLIMPPTSSIGDGYAMSRRANRRFASTSQYDSNRTSTVTPIKLYHYTDVRSAILIKKEQCIKQSGGYDDALFGPGVYMTTLDPSESTEKVAFNNYDGSRFWKRKIDEGKLEVAFKLVLDKSKVISCCKDRSIYRYPSDLNLSDTLRWDIIVR